MQMYPHWNARDNYRFGVKKKKKRQRDRTLEDPGTNLVLFTFQWHALSKEAQSKYYEEARRERQEHMRQYPGWTARDNYAKHKKKRRRKEIVRETAESLAAAPAAANAMAHNGANGGWAWIAMARAVSVNVALSVSVCQKV